MATAPKLIIVGAGMGGLSCAVRAAQLGLDVTILEKSPKIGGTASFSGGQVWVGGNHLEAAAGIEDSVEEALTYVHDIAAARDASSIDSALADRWIRGAARAARHFEDSGVIRWEIVPTYPDYYYPKFKSGRREGRYLTGAMFDGTTLGAWLPRLQLSPYFLSGITYAELFSWGGVSSRTAWDWDLIARRREEHKMTFGPSISAAFLHAALALGVDIRIEQRVRHLREENGRITGVEVEGDEGSYSLEGTVVLATGAHDWSPKYAERFIGMAWEDNGSIAPPYLTGDGLDMASDAGAALKSIPAWGAPILPGYQVDGAPLYPGDQGFRNCLESGLPHAFLVNARGERFCDDSFHSDIVYTVLREDAQGQRPNLPLFLVWDSNHHQRYGMGATPPGGAYPDGIVVQADTLAALGEKLGIDGAALDATAERFNGPAREGCDPDFDRGNNLSVQVFRGDWHHKPHPNIGPVERAPFFGMRMRMVGTGIAAGGIAVDSEARALRPDGRVIDGLFAVGEVSARDAAGVGYNSGYSLSRAMTFGMIAAERAAADMGQQEQAA